MNKQDILILYQYNAWSNAKILDAASNITQAQFLAPAPFPHGGLRGTLVHALFGEWLWRQRWEGTAPAFTFRLKAEEFPTVESLRALCAVPCLAPCGQRTMYFQHKYVRLLKTAWKSGDLFLTKL
jgi:uncharacterized damage-inducible protein DinB